MVRFVETLQGHPELARCVFERMGRGGRVKEEIKMEEEVEETKSEDDVSLPSLNLGRGSPWSFLSTSRNDSLGHYCFAVIWRLHL